MNKYSDFKIHPAANVFPLLDDNSYQALKADINANGQWEMIMRHDERIIDGRNRLRACCELGIEPNIGELPIDIDPYNYVIGVNLHRRHLDKGQRSMIADKLATMRQGEKKADTGIPVSPPSQVEAAAMLNVSVDSVQKARKVRAKATKKVIAAVESGTMSLNAAVKTTKPEEPKKKNGTEKVSAAKLVDALTKQHIGHIARGLTNIAKANGGEGVQFKAADAGLNQTIIALQKMREGET